MKEIKLIIKILIFASLATYFIFGFVLYINQKNFVYFPDNQDFEACKEFLDSEKISYNGTRAYFKKNSDKLIIFYHGNAGSTCIRDFLKDEFEKMGYSYIFAEYSGYSGDERIPSKELLMEDVENINDFVREKDFSKIVIMGESLGTSLASYHSTLLDADKLLLVSPFSSTADLAKASYRIYPVSLMLKEDYDTYEWLKKTKAKDVQILHGTEDMIIPIEQSRKLMAGISLEDKKLIEISGARHNDMYDFKETQTSINNYLSQ